jgi:hypothetical protein
MRPDPDHDPNPYADCDFIVCYGGATVYDKHLAATVHCVDDEIIGWLERREQRRRDRVAPGAVRQGIVFDTKR